MAEALRVVARFTEGKILKGTTQDFNPTRPVFHLIEAGGGSVQIRCDQLKALYFVKTFAGDKGRTKLRGFIAAPSETAQGRKIAVLFKDGELICGYSLTFAPDRSGFFVFPSDSTSNNDRIFVIKGAVAEVKTGPAAEALAEQVLAAQASSAKAARKS